MQIDEEDLFEAYFRAYAAPVHTFVMRRAGADVAQDVTSETFLVAWRRRSEMPADPLPWLYGVARRVLANEQRAASRRVALAGRVSAETGPHVSAASGEGGALGALAALRESDREALWLVAWEGLSHRDAARVVGCSAPTFAVRVHRARRRLARLLIETETQGDRAQPHNTVTSEVSG